MLYVNRSKLKIPSLKSQEGVSVYFTVIILAVLLAASLETSQLLIGQFSRLQRAGDSVSAFFAADAGIERTLLIDKSTCQGLAIVDRITCIGNGVASLSAGQKTLVNGAEFALVIQGGGQGSCPSQKNYCVRSTGIFKGATRTLRITR